VVFKIQIYKYKIQNIYYIKMKKSESCFQNNINCISSLLIVLLLFFVENLKALENCYPNAMIGCLNGVPFIRKSQFACGNDVYLQQGHGCCDEAVPFNSTAQYCCYSGVHNRADSHCAEFPPSFKTMSPVNKETKIPPALNPKYPPAETDDDPVQTVNCTHGSLKYGCLNGNRYSWNLQYPCYDSLALYASQGCCNGKVFDVQTETCCYNYYFNNEYDVINRGHACDASSGPAAPKKQTHRIVPN